MSFREEYEAKYKEMRSGAVTVNGELLEWLIRTCQTNPWLKRGGADFEPEGFCCEHDYPYGLERYDDVDKLRMFFEHGNWGIRAAVMHRDLIFVNQVNGGDEWWTLKITADDMIPFESFSWGRIIERSPRTADTSSVVSVLSSQELKDAISDRPFAGATGIDPFAAMIERLVRATPEQCKKLDY
jgi:hypothetical protein